MKISYDIDLPTTGDKQEIFTSVGNYLGELALSVATVDTDRPWGGFYCISEEDTDRFIETYFPELDRSDIEKGGKLSPKILIVAPEKRLSWQYHDRRAELWKVISGPVGVCTSPTDEQGPVQKLEQGETVQFDRTIRHRLIGLDNWGIVAEIWQHTDAAHPSEEDDIVRIQDDFAR